MEIVPAEIEDTFYGPSHKKGELVIEKAHGHDRSVRALAKCPWCPSSTLAASILVDYCKGGFWCLVCGAMGLLVVDPEDVKHRLMLQREIEN